VGVLLGNGDGTFQPVVIYGSGAQNAVSIAVADVNSDGKPDVVVTNNCVTSTCDASAVGVLLGNGDGTFQAAVDYPSGGLSPSSVVVGDVNGDGKPDLLVGNFYLGNGNYSRGSVGLLLGNGDGTFQGPVSFDSGGEYAYGVALGDINGDGKLDLLVANFCADSTCASGGVSVFLGKGDGSFQPVVTYGSGGLNSYSVAVGDVNADGKPDLLIGDPDPFYDDCGGPEQIAMTGTNVGDLLNAKGVTWGWFQGGFTPTTPASASSPAVCAAATTNLGGSLQKDYSAHHEPFQYYKSTANPHHLPPTSVSMIGKTDQANHQYDLTDFTNAVDAGNMPAVSFLKAKRSQDGHAGYSSPLDEQEFIVSTLNALQQRPEWSSTAVVIAYDDSDGWYDHQMSPILRQSVSSQDALTGAGHCGDKNTGGIAGRCGYGPRLPLLMISPFAKSNFVDNTVSDQTSILRFMEDNFALGRIGARSSDQFAGTFNNMLNLAKPRTDILILDSSTGEPAQ